jgi:hypothetical protein
MAFWAWDGSTATNGDAPFAILNRERNRNSSCLTSYPVSQMKRERVGMAATVL